MSDTPRTDAIPRSGPFHHYRVEDVLALCRTLERELAEAKQQAKDNHLFATKFAAERDALKAQLEEAKRSDAFHSEACAAHQSHIDQLQGDYEQMKEDRNRLFAESERRAEEIHKANTMIRVMGEQEDALRLQLDTAQREAAAMREALEFTRKHIPSHGTYSEDWINIVDAALSSPLGQGWVRREEATPIVFILRPRADGDGWTLTRDGIAIAGGSRVNCEDALAHETLKGEKS